MYLTRQQFYQQYMVFQTGARTVRRFVAKADIDAQKKDGDNKEDGKYMSHAENAAIQKYRMFVPESHDDDFQLVLSLCDDGLHRPCVDIDFQEESLHLTKFGETCSVFLRDNGSQTGIGMWDGIFRSTHHFHGYDNTPYQWEEALERYGVISGEDARRYREVSKARGVFAVRAPWLRKDGTITDIDRLEGSAPKPRQEYPPGARSWVSADEVVEPFRLEDIQELYEKARKGEAKSL